MILPNLESIKGRVGNWSRIDLFLLMSLGEHIGVIRSEPKALEITPERFGGGPYEIPKSISFT
jgi:hypothetical protein